jgi:hypothetical protein
VPVRPALPATVVITQARHPLEGRDLRVLGWMRRLGRLELMLELPDGSKRLSTATRTRVRARGRWAGQRTCWACRCWFRLFAPGAAMTGSRLHETHLPRRTIVQPVQLSLLPDQVPAPPPELIGQLPGSQVETATTLLAGLIARAAVAAGAGDE